MFYSPLWSSNEELLGLGVPRRGLLLVVDVEAYGLVRVDAQSLLDHLSYPSDPVGLTSVSEPHSQLVSFATNVNNSSVDLKNVEGKKESDRGMKVEVTW